VMATNTNTPATTNAPAYPTPPATVNTPAHADTTATANTAPNANTAANATAPANPNTLSIANKAATATPSSGRRRSTRNGGHQTPKRKAEIDWEELEERGKRRRREDDTERRRRDSVTHLVASIYADIEAAIEIQRRIAGTGPALTEEEQSAFEASEDIRLDHLRELRLAALCNRNQLRSPLMRASVPRGKRYDSVRVARDIVSKIVTERSKKLAAIVGTLGWSLIAICLHSDNFRTRFLETTDADDHVRRMEQLQIFKSSIQFFAQSRSFNWLEGTPEQQAQNVLVRDLKSIRDGNGIPVSQELQNGEAERAELNVQTRIDGFYTDRTAIDHPHEWKLSSDGRLAKRLDFECHPPREPKKRRAELQRNIEQSEILFRGHRWAGRKDWLLKDDPRYRSDLDDPCEACDDVGDVEGKRFKVDCQCTFNELKTRLAADGAYVGDRVEMRQINPVMGTGVRALQRFPGNAVLAEYVGDIYPSENHAIYGDATYVLAQRRVQKDGSNKDAMKIDPIVRGNWTRYINHSCSPNTEFLVHSCGDKMLMCVKVRNEPIELGEEITVHYGKDYFIKQRLACRCGQDSCTTWNADTVADNKITLEDAKTQGIAPDWGE
jgi:SET domain